MIQMTPARQTLLGIAMFFGGSIMLYALVQQVRLEKATDEAEPHPLIENQTDSYYQQPLTAAVEEERRFLLEKQKARQASVAEQERLSEQLIEDQERAKLEALKKASQEKELYQQLSNANASDDSLDSDVMEETDISAQNTITTPVVKVRPVEQKAIDPAANTTQDKKSQNSQNTTVKTQDANQQAREAEKNKKELQAKKQENKPENKPDKKPQEAKPADDMPQQLANRSVEYTVKRGDGLIKLSKRYGIPVEVLAQANNLNSRSSLHVGQKLTIPSKKQMARLEQAAKQAAIKEEQEKQKQQALAQKSAEARKQAQQKLKEARKEVKETDAKGTFGVQVALATNQAKADEIAKKFQQAGYQVKTSQTSRGVRVMVGPERGKVAALALKDKINSDPKVNTTQAWVLYWR